MGKSKAKITNWCEYNRALCQRGSVTFGLVTQPLKRGNVRSITGSEAEVFNTQMRQSKLPLR